MYMQMLSLLKQMHIHTFDERSEPEKSQIFRVSALNADYEDSLKICDFSGFCPERRL